jgi:DNA-binding GntR family transcriptional regulator
LASHFNVSRTPICEVIFALQKDGLMQRVRNQGAKVVSFTAEDVEEVFDVRRVLECFCISNAVHVIRMSDLLSLEQRLQTRHTLELFLSRRHLDG